LHGESGALRKRRRCRRDAEEEQDCGKAHDDPGGLRGSIGHGREDSGGAAGRQVSPPAITK
jgi:hypothetical protein